MQTHDIDSSATESALKRGVAAARAGLLSLATSQLQRAVENDPDDPNIWLWLGWVANSPDNAIRCLEEVLRLSPGHPAAVAGLTWARFLVHDDMPTPRAEAEIGVESETPIEAVSIQHDSAPKEVCTSETEVAAEAIHHETAEEISPENTSKTADNLVDGWEVLPTPQSAEAVCHAVRQTIQQAQSESSSTELSRQWDAVLHRDAEPQINLVIQSSASPKPAESLFLPSSQSPSEGDSREELPPPTESPVLGVSSADSGPGSNADLDAVETSFRPSMDTVSDDGRPLIMVIDDSPTVRKLVSLTLERRGYRVISAFDGIAAIKELGGCRPDLILLDINMPRLDGYRLCKLIKKHDATQNIPVVMLSGKDGMFDKLRGRLVGCSDYITKPFEADALTNKVAKYLTPASSSL